MLMILHKGSKYFLKSQKKQMGSFIALYLPRILYHSVHIGSAIEMAPEEYIFFQGGPPCK